jgi:cytochrome c553
MQLRIIAAVAMFLAALAASVGYAADATTPAAGNGAAAASAPAHDPTQAPWIELSDTRAPSASAGKYIFKTKADCVYCHGWPGDGMTGKSPRSPGQAANLRKTQLDTDDMIQIIACGIPGSPMPYHDPQAYLDKRCYGQTMADFKGQTPPQSGHFLTDQDIVNVVAYVEQNIKGKGPITKAECEAFFQPGASACRNLK